MPPRSVFSSAESALQALFGSKEFPSHFTRMGMITMLTHTIHLLALVYFATYSYVFSDHSSRDRENSRDHATLYWTTWTMFGFIMLVVVLRFVPFYNASAVVRRSMLRSKDVAIPLVEAILYALIFALFPLYAYKNRHTKEPMREHYVLFYLLALVGVAARLLHWIFVDMAKILHAA
tara:strand:+ start:604 stop:1134 length:531 start_codon:yes stop_codon:yes gene_type:complete